MSLAAHGTLVEGDSGTHIVSIDTKLVINFTCRLRSFLLEIIDVSFILFILLLLKFVDPTLNFLKQLVRADN